MITIRHDKKFPREEAIPEKPGIYSWYYNYEKLSDTSDRSSLIEEMVSISKKLCKPSLKGNMKGHLGTKYEAEMENVDFIQLDEIKQDSLKRMDERELKNILDILNKFAPPLYIGITKDLKTRYNKHLRDYMKAKSSGEAEKDIFGSRLFLMGIEPRELFFKYQVLDTFERSNIELLEHIANRLFKPIAGRR